MGKAVDGFIGKVEHGLKGVLRACLLLKVEKVGREDAAGGFYLYEHPRGSVADDQEIDFTLLFVTKITEFECSQSEICPRLHRFEKVTRGKRLGARARI